MASDDSGGHALPEISQCIARLRAEGRFSIDKLLEECEAPVTFESLQQLKRPENRRRFHGGQVSDKELSERLTDALLPFGILNQGGVVYGNIDYPEDGFLEGEHSGEMTEYFPGGPISISLFTQEMIQMDRAYMEGRSRLLDAVYAPYFYQFTVGRAPSATAAHSENLSAYGDHCTFEELCTRVRSINGGNDSRWFCAKLFHRREDAIKNGVGEPLCGEVRFICGKTSVESAYLCITGGEVSPDIVSFYDWNQPDPTDYEAHIAREDGTASLSQPDGGQAAPGPGDPYKIKLYNTGQGSCTYLMPRKPGSQARFFFDAGATCYPNNQKKNEQRAEVRRAFLGIASSAPDFIILSHWHMDHYNLIFKFRKLVTCPWIVPEIPADLPKSTASMLNVLKKTNKLHLFGSAGADRLVRSSGIVCLERGSGPGRNNSGVLIQMRQTLLPGDCTYPYWPANFPAGQKFRYLVVPHHGARIFGKSGGGKNRVLPPRAAAVLSQAGTAFVCTGENIYGHPDGDHMEALNDHLCSGTGAKSSWHTNQQICLTGGSPSTFFEWDDV